MIEYILHFVVNRIEARSEQFDMFMLLDVNTEIYPMRVKDKFMMVLASTLNLDGTPDTGYFIQVICCSGLCLLIDLQVLACLI